MQRWQLAALAVACSACLEPLVDDNPGYSRNVLPPGSAVPSAYADLQVSRKIDMNDGVSPPLVELKTGYANGSQVQYWDLGAAKRAAVPAYALTRCGPDGRALPDARLMEWPLIMETIPGDPDYSQYRAISWVCLTDKFSGEVISSSDAIDDAVELGLVLDPAPADFWINLPVVSPGVELASPSGPRAPQRAFHKGTEVVAHSFDDQEGRFPYGNGATVGAGRVYEILKGGSPAPVRVIFSEPYATDGVRNPAYSPQWSLYSVTLKPLEGDEATTADMDIESWTRESDIVEVNPKSGTPAPKHPRVAAVTASMATSRVNRPFFIGPVAP